MIIIYIFLGEFHVLVRYTLGLRVLPVSTELSLFESGGFGIHSWIHSCCIASIGLSLCSGIHSRHFVTKSRNFRSRLLTMLFRGLEAGICRFPREFSVIMISPLRSKKSFFRGDIASSSLGGNPTTYVINCIYSYSLSPGYSGYPVNSSTMIQPKDHMSILVVYGIPRMISGAR